MLRRLLFGPLLVLLSLGFGGCQNSSPVSSPGTGNTNTQAVAQDWERQGVISQQEYVRAVNTLAYIRRTGKVSDQDLDWLLSLLKQPTSNPTAVHLLVMAELINLNSVSDAQSQKVRAAIDPFQQSNDSTERDLSTLVLKNLRQSTSSTNYIWLIVVFIAGGLAFLIRRRMVRKNN